MSQNNVQLQKGMSLDQLIERYGTDSECEQARNKGQTLLIWFTGPPAIQQWPANKLDSPTDYKNSQ